MRKHFGTDIGVDRVFNNWKYGYENNIRYYIE